MRCLARLSLIITADNETSLVLKRSVYCSLKFWLFALFRDKINFCRNNS